MKSRASIWLAAPMLFVELITPTRIIAQHQRDDNQHHYRLIDLGTFGGPSSYLAGSNGVNDAVNRVLNNRGTVVGWGDTSNLDPFAPNCFEPFPNGDCSLPLAFQWKKGGR